MGYPDSRGEYGSAGESLADGASALRAERASVQRAEPGIFRALGMLGGEVGRLEDAVDRIRSAYSGAAGEGSPVAGSDEVGAKPFGSSELTNRVHENAGRLHYLIDQLNDFASRSELVN